MIFNSNDVALAKIKDVEFQGMYLRILKCAIYFVYAVNATNEGSDCECGMYAWDCIYNKMKSICNVFKMKMSLKFLRIKARNFQVKQCWMCVEKCCAWLLECFMFVNIVDPMKEEGERECVMNSYNCMF